MGEEGLHCINCKFLQFFHIQVLHVVFIFKSLTSIRAGCSATSNCLVKLLLLVVKLLSRKLGLGKDERQAIILAEENDLSLDL